MSDVDKPASHRWRPRFSLLEFLLLTTIVALSIVVEQLWRDVGPLRVEVRRLRAETGRLTIDDPKQVYAVAIDWPQTVGRTWKWRFYLPDNHKYALHIATRPVPETGFPKLGESTGESSSLECGEHVGEVSVRKDESGDWYLHSVIQKVLPDGGFGARSGITVSLQPKDDDWLKASGRAGWSGVTSQSPQAFEPDQPLELLRLRPREFIPTYPGAEDARLQGLGTEQPIKGPTDGALIWIEEQP
jgi:hypothetical protein